MRKCAKGFRRDAPQQCLNKMHGRENTHMPFFLKIFDDTRSQWPSLLHANAPPDRKEESLPPPVTPLSGKKNLGPGHSQEGEDGRQYLLRWFVFPMCHTHILALLSHHFKSVTCVYSVIFSLQRRCTGVVGLFQAQDVLSR